MSSEEKRGGKSSPFEHEKGGGEVPLSVGKEGEKRKEVNSSRGRKGVPRGGEAIVPSPERGGGTTNRPKPKPLVEGGKEGGKISFFP